MSDEDDKVKRLPVRFKMPPSEEGPVLRVVSRFGGQGGCDHRYYPGTMRHVTYAIREGETEVECGCCAVKLDPMWVLRVLAGQDSQFDRRRDHVLAEEKRLRERQSTKCEHCKRMTKISRN